MQISEKINGGDMSTKPGWVRFSVHPIMTNEEILMFVNAIREMTLHINEWRNDYRYDMASNDYFYIHHKRTDMAPLFRFT